MIATSHLRVATIEILFVEYIDLGPKNGLRRDLLASNSTISSRGSMPPDPP